MFGYGIPHLLIDHAMRNPHVPPGFWRGVNLNHNAIYVEVLHRRGGPRHGKGSAGFPPLMADPEAPAVLEAVAQRAAGEARADVNGRRCSAGWRRRMDSAVMSPACAEVSVAPMANSPCTASSRPPIAATR